jgi:O-antigen/teichoic acid export membrane protein
MLKKILQTISTRVIVAIISFAIVVFTTNFFGAEGRGEISLFVLNLTLVSMFSLVGGTSLVYLTSRVTPENLLLPSYFWAFNSSIGITALLWFVGLQNTQFIYHLGLLALMESLTQVNLQLVLGDNRIARYNLVQFLQVVLLLAGLALAYFVFNLEGIEAYIAAFYVSRLYSVAHSLSSIYSLLGFEKPEIIRANFWLNLKNLFSYGWVIQTANIAQLLNYRVSYWLLEKLLPEKGTQLVGIYSTGINLAEAIWILSRSVSTVQYAEISNTRDDSYQVDLTVGLFKLNTIITFLGMIPLLIIPSTWFEWVFGQGENFDQIQLVLLFLFPGIVANAAAGSLSHYFSGVARYHVNTYGSIAGLVVTLILGILLIPSMGLAGAAIAASGSYITSLFYQWVVFLKKENVKWQHFLLDERDIARVKTLFYRSKD